MMAFDFFTFLCNLLGAVIGLVITLGWFLCSWSVAVYFDSWIIGMVMFTTPLTVMAIYKLGQKS